MKELLRRLEPLIGPGRRYSSAAELSLALRSNPTLVAGWFRGPHQEPTLAKLYDLSRELGWRYSDVVC